MRMPVMFLTQTQAPGYSKTWFDYSRAESYGNNNFGVGYKAESGMTYSRVGNLLPFAADFNGGNELWARVFGYKTAVLNMNAEFDFNVDKVTKSYFDYLVTAFDKRVWGKRYYIPSSYTDADEIKLWNTQDEKGNEKYSKDTGNAQKKEKDFMAGPVPVTVVGGLTGEVGIRGEVRYIKTNKMVLDAGPYASLTGTLEGGVGLVAGDPVIETAGTDIDLTLINISLKLKPSVQILPSDAGKPSFGFEAPVELSTLDGKAYIFAKPSSVKYRFNIIEWDGLSYKLPFFPKLSATFGASD